MRRSRFGWLLLATGIFIPFVTAPFGEGYRHGASLIENIQSMTLPITPDRSEPVFGEIKQADIDADWPFVDIGSTGELSSSSTGHVGRYAVLVDPDPGKIRLFLPNRQSEDEVRWALKAGRKQIENSTPKYLAYYYGKVSRKGVRLPFSFLVSGSLVLAFLGMVLLISTRTRT